MASITLGRSPSSTTAPYMRPPLLLLALSLVATPRLGMAQSMTTLGDSVRIRVVAADTMQSATVRLVGSGAPVRVLGLHALSADTVVVNPPIELLLPSGVFRLLVTALNDAQGAVLVYDSPPTNRPGSRVRTRWSPPVLLERRTVTDSLRITAPRMTAEIIP